MIPLTSHVNEMWLLKERLSEAAESAQTDAGVKVGYLFGTMIEVPRAAVTAGEIAAVAEFFSFGTNDLTQTTYGFSRDDAEGKFLNRYISDGILPNNPFTTLDPNGVGALIRIAVEQGRRIRPGLEVGICGEHGGDPASIAFCHKEGLDYVSCSPSACPSPAWLPPRRRWESSANLSDPQLLHPLGCHSNLPRHRVVLWTLHVSPKCSPSRMWPAVVRASTPRCVAEACLWALQTFLKVW